MPFDILQIGQGIAGTFLNWYLKKAGFSVLVVDEPESNSASRVASGIINPVTGRRLVKTWMIDELMPFAVAAYQELGHELHVAAINSVSIVDFFPSPQMRLAFMDRVAENAQYLTLADDENAWTHQFHYPFGYGCIDPAYLVNLPELLPAYRKRISAEGILREERIEWADLKVTQGWIQYQGESFKYLLFADGKNAVDHPLFRRLPFALNKGEALLVEIADLPQSHIYKKGYSLVPWTDGLFWLGSTYEWEFESDKPSSAFYEGAKAWLEGSVKLPFRIRDHRAALRPATIERRPFIGMHPLHPNIGIFNGMGTKGCSLSPYFARQLAEHLKSGSPIEPAAEVGRFRKILSPG